MLPVLLQCVPSAWMELLQSFYYHLFLQICGLIQNTNWISSWDVREGWGKEWSH